MIRRACLCDACDRFRKRPYRRGEVNPFAGTSGPQDVGICDAFPDAIPAGIYWGGFDHRTRYPGDHGIRFTLRPGKDSILRLYDTPGYIPDEDKTRITGSSGSSES